MTITQVLIDERARFEAWHRSKYMGCDYRHLDKGFLHARVQLDFEIWQAAISQHKAVPDGFVLPNTAEDVIDFIGIQYVFMQTHDENGNLLSLENISYCLTVHELLSAFELFKMINGIPIAAAPNTPDGDK